MREHGKNEIPRNRTLLAVTQLPPTKKREKGKLLPLPRPRFSSPTGGFFASGHRLAMLRQAMLRDRLPKIYQ